MNKIDINLATMRRQKRVLPALAVLATLAVAVLMTWSNAGRYNDNVSVTASHRADVERLEARFDPTLRGRGGLTVKETRVLSEKVRIINGIIVRETFSWTSLLSDLEESVPDGISIASISPDFEKKSIRIKGMGETMDRVLTLVNALDDSERFSDVFLVSHAETKLKITTKSFVSFVITSGYSGSVES